MNHRCDDVVENYQFYIKNSGAASGIHHFSVNLAVMPELKGFASIRKGA